MHEACRNIGCNHQSDGRCMNLVACRGADEVTEDTDIAAHMLAAVEPGDTRDERFAAEHGAG